MDALIRMKSLDLSPYRFGEPQRSGAMTVMPLLGSGVGGEFTRPASGLKLSGVHGYGNVELRNNAAGTCIVPLHIGYIQDQAQNHALCRSTIIGRDQIVRVTDACCVQASQGGYLKEAEQWFFILPLQLREEALRLRGKQSYSKLWPAISKLNAEMGLEERGHLEQIISRLKPHLNQYQNRFELVDDQIGAVFFLRGKIAGIEIAPDRHYFADIWKALVCFCYGPAAMREETHASTDCHADRPLTGATVREIRECLTQSRKDFRSELERIMLDTPGEDFSLTEEERYIDLSLNTAEGKNYAGQVVLDAGKLIYASIFIRAHYYNS